jgi:hypothetical protein
MLTLISRAGVVAVRRRASAALAAAGLLATSALAGCAAPSERSAGLFYNEARLCVQNLTTSNVELTVATANDGTLVDDNGAKRERSELLLGPQAFSCRTTSSSVSYPSIKFWLKSGSEWSDQMRFSNSQSNLNFRVAPDESIEALVLGGNDKQSFVITPNEPFTVSLDDLPGLTLVGESTGQLRTFPNGLKAYQLDVRLVPGTL